LLKEKDGTTYAKEVRISDDPADLKGLLNETRWEILELLAERPRYPAAIAEEMGVHEQKVYYHIRELESAGFIEVTDREERGGATAKYYSVIDDAYALELPYGDERLADVGVTSAPSSLRSFLTPFVRNGEMAAEIVVGSPDPHGPHQVRARDAPIAVDLALFLGQYGSFTGSATREDVDIRSGNGTGGNLILVGGPLTNLVTADMNPYLPVRFETDNFPYREITS
ncbi:MAG: ArsR/SmtB family transcription factor, partial [Candidatus Nanohaloarchaea archaeon]